MSIQEFLEIVVKDHPGKTREELAHLSGSNSGTIASYLYKGPYVMRYSSDLLKPIYFYKEDFTANYHPETLDEARKKQAHFKHNVVQYLVKTLIEDKKHG